MGCLFVITGMVASDICIHVSSKEKASSYEEIVKQPSPQLFLKNKNSKLSTHHPSSLCQHAAMNPLAPK